MDDVSDSEALIFKYYKILYVCDCVWGWGGLVGWLVGMLFA